VNWKKIDWRILVLIAFAIHGGIFDGLFGIDAVKNQSYPVDYLSFWGAYLSIYFFVAIVLLFGIKDKLRLLQAAMTGFAVWGFGRLIFLFDALRLGFIDQNRLLQMRFEFTNILGTPVSFSFYEVIALNLMFVISAVFMEFFRKKLRQ